MNIPPVVGMLASLVVGIAIGAGGMYQHYSKELLEVQTKLRAEDNNKAKEIQRKTDEFEGDKALAKVVVKYKEKKVRYCPEATNEEIDTMCANRYVPADIMRPILDQINRARGRVNTF